MDKKILFPVSLLFLLAIDVMAFGYINSDNDGLYMFGWFALFFSAILYIILIMRYLSNIKDKA